MDQAFWGSDIEGSVPNAWPAALRNNKRPAGKVPAYRVHGLEMASIFLPPSPHVPELHRIFYWLQQQAKEEGHQYFQKIWCFSAHRPPLSICCVGNTRLVCVQGA